MLGFKNGQIGFWPGKRKNNFHLVFLQNLQKYFHPSSLIHLTVYNAHLQCREPKKSSAEGSNVKKYESAFPL